MILFISLTGHILMVAFRSYYMFNVVSLSWKDKLRRIYVKTIYTITQYELQIHLIVILIGPLSIGLEICQSVKSLDN